MASNEIMYDLKPVQPSPVKIHDDIVGDRDGRLASMGLTVTQLVQVMESSAGGYASTTSFHPVSTPGTYLYHEATASLRRAVMSSGQWAYDEEDSQPRTHSDVFGLAIVVQTGDENTGSTSGPEPKPRNPKGQATEAKVQSNRDQFVLFNVGTTNQDEPADGPVFINWVLLIAVVDGVIRAELSRPTEMIGGKPCGWAERIILPEQVMGGSYSSLDGTDEATPETDINVVWKG